LPETGGFILLQKHYFLHLTWKEQGIVDF